MKKVSLSIMFLLVVLLGPARGQSLSLVTWNIQTMGRSKSDAEIGAMARILRDADIVAVQEVVGKDPAGVQAVARLADALDRTGADWDYVYSDPTTGTAHESERYAYLWKTSRASLVGRPGLVGEFADLVVREPFVAHFRTKAGDLVLVNFHAVPHDRQPEREIKEIRSLATAFGDTPVIFMADWNVVDHHTVFNPLRREGYRFAVEGQLTTLKRDCAGGQYRNHGIDNIFFPPAFELVRSGVLDFVGDCNRLEEARMISDHLPVWVEVRRRIRP
ncbi:MAG: endonuclease/exonuclease/phosphatase family protein [Lewinellaceae bacterium]|nr:endonuclease/exonuclease/phosphatase family protein [Saprospiraceae bacterium]MCB9312615.1 endonuclease/exonuclease/phosphatase family protein [Lewinellaceae bacterium]HRW75768.1 endonuclease/exonuclease/phosphatase family protein [Saprospiraceae bacterium]